MRVDELLEHASGLICLASDEHGPLANALQKGGESVGRELLSVNVIGANQKIALMSIDLVGLMRLLSLIEAVSENMVYFFSIRRCCRTACAPCRRPGCIVGMRTGRGSL